MNHILYEIILTDEAIEGISKLRLSGDKAALKKLNILISELEHHPETGTGHPKPLGENRVGQWSRRITQKHRLIYEINDKDVVVLVISTYGHYDDK